VECELRSPNRRNAGRGRSDQSGGARPRGPRRRLRAHLRAARTAGLALIETGSGSEEDLLDRLFALLPRDAGYRHEHGARGHGRDHLVPAFLPPALVLAVRNDRLDLGPWQSLVLVDTNVDNAVRTVRLSFIPDSGAAR